MKHTYIKPLAVVLLLGLSTLTLSSAFAHKGKEKSELKEGAIEAPSTTTANVSVTPYPSYSFDAKNVVGVPLDSAPGFPGGSLASNGVAKSDMYFVPEILFGHPVKLGDIVSMSYWTKTGFTHIAPHEGDWFLAIYTKPYTDDVSTKTWYGDRIGTEPYFSINPTNLASGWTNWTTSGLTNRLRFFESTEGAEGANFGEPDDLDWAAFVSGTALSGKPYVNHEILYFSLQTGNPWAVGFTGQVDGLRIELKDGSVANINFEASNFVVTNKEKEEERKK